MTANQTITGTVKFFNREKQFGFISFANEPDMYFTGKVAGDIANRLFPGTSVKVVTATEYQGGKFKKIVTAVALNEPVTVLDTVKWYNRKKGFGVIHCSDAGLSLPTASLHKSVCKKAGDITPDEGMAVLAVVIETEKGPVVLSFQWGDAIQAQWSAKQSEIYAKDCNVTPAEPTKPVKKAKARKAATKPKGKVTGKPGGIPSAKDYRVDPKDIASMAAHQCANGGGVLAQAMLAAVVLN